MTLAWGEKVSALFRQRVTDISAGLGIDPSWLMACIAFESAETFSAAVRNSAGSGAVGLIQFMPQTAHLLGTTTEDLAAMTDEGQLDFVEKYFAPRAGGLHTLSDVYMAILWPAAVGKPEDAVLFTQANTAHPLLYIENKGLDFNHDGQITKSEATAGPSRKLIKGMLPEFVWEDAA